MLGVVERSMIVIVLNVSGYYENKRLIPEDAVKSINQCAGRARCFVLKIAVHERSPYHRNYLPR